MTGGTRASAGGPVIKSANDNTRATTSVRMRRIFLMMGHLLYLSGRAALFFSLIIALFTCLWEQVPRVEESSQLFSFLGFDSPHHTPLLQDNTRHISASCRSRTVQLTPKQFSTSVHDTSARFSTSALVSTPLGFSALHNKSRLRVITQQLSASPHVTTPQFSASGQSSPSHLSASNRHVSDHFSASDQTTSPQISAT